MTASSEPVDARDLRTLGLLAETYGRLDPVPSDFTERISFALAVRSLEAEVAQLVEAQPLAVRGAESAPGIESVTFSSGRVSLMVSTSRSADRVRIDGWVTCGGAHVEVVSTDQTITGIADENGRFVVDGVAHGSVMFVIHLDPADPDETPVVTPRIEV